MVSRGFSVEEIHQAAKIIAQDVGLYMPEESVWKLVKEAFDAWQDDDYTLRDAYANPKWAAEFVTFYLDSFER